MVERGHLPPPEPGGAGDLRAGRSRADQRARHRRPASPSPRSRRSRSTGATTNPDDALAEDDWRSPAPIAEAFSSLPPEDQDGGPREGRARGSPSASPSERRRSTAVALVVVATSSRRGAVASRRDASTARNWCATSGRVGTRASATPTPTLLDPRARDPLGADGQRIPRGPMGVAPVDRRDRRPVRALGGRGRRGTARSSPRSLIVRGRDQGAGRETAASTSISRRAGWSTLRDGRIGELHNFIGRLGTRRGAADRDRPR